MSNPLALSDPEALDASDYVGMNLNSLTNADPLDIGNLLKQIPSGARGLKLSDQNHEQQVTFAVKKVNQSRKFQCSKNLKVSKNVTANDELRTCNSGSEATKFLQVDASASASYGGWSGSAGTTYRTNSSFSENSVYAFYSWQETCYDVALDTHPENLLDPDFIETVNNLPPWNANDKDVVQQYQDFFDTNGTHTIIGATSGWRYLLRIDCNKVNSNFTSEFSAYVKAEYNGVGSMSASADIKTQEDYKSYLANSHAVCSVRGGDVTANSAAQSSADRANGAEPGPEFSQWVASTSDGTGEEILSVKIIKLPDLLRRNSKTKVASSRVADALVYLSGVIFRGRLSGWSDRMSFHLIDPPPTTRILVQSPPPSINTQPFQPSHYWVGPDSANVGIIVDGGWEHTTNLSVEFQLRLGNANDIFSFQLQHGGDGGDTGNFSMIQFFPMDGVNELYHRKNPLHGFGTNNEMIYSDQQIQVDA